MNKIRSFSFIRQLQKDCESFHGHHLYCGSPGICPGSTREGGFYNAPRSPAELDVFVYCL